MSEASGWDAVILLRRTSPAEADRLALALGPEVVREVPRARTRVDRPHPATVRLSITARDTGSLRAALNTYLGWVQLALATERSGGAT